MSFLLLAAAIAAAQEDKPAALEGDVRNSVTGGPVVHAHVHLTGSQGRKPQTYGAITDAEGKFSMNGLDPGSYTAMVTRVGFVATVETGALAAARISLGRGDRKTEFHLKLMPAGSIAGRVLDSAGEPVEGITVSLEGGMGPNSFGTVTDDKGQFRIGGLAPRKYRVKATPMMMPMPPEIRTDGTVEANYVSTFYPASLEARSAGKVEVKPGEEVTGIEIRLVQTPPVRVSGRVAGLPAAVKNSMIELRGQDGRSGTGGRVKPDGTFEVWRVAPGKYSLNASWNEGGQWTRSAPLDIEVAQSHLDNLELRMIPPFDIAGRVVFDDEKAKGEPPQQQPQGRQSGQQGQPQQRGLVLREIRVGMGPQQATVADDGTFRLTNVSPGRYRVMPLWGRVYVKSMQLGQVHTDGSMLDLSNGAAGESLEVVVSSAMSEVSGVVSDSKGPIEGARVAMLLEDSDVALPPSNVTAGPGGVYRFPYVAPGRYRLAAIEDNDQLMWNNVEDYEDTLVTVEVGAGDKVTKDLKRR